MKHGYSFVIALCVFVYPMPSPMQTLVDDHLNENLLACIQQSVSCKERKDCVYRWWLQYWISRMEVKEEMEVVGQPVLKSDPAAEWRKDRESSAGSPPSSTEPSDKEAKLQLNSKVWPEWSPWSTLRGWEGGQWIGDCLFPLGRGRRQWDSTHGREGVCAWLVQRQRSYFSSLMWRWKWWSWRSRYHFPAV